MSAKYIARSQTSTRPGTESRDSSLPPPQPTPAPSAADTDGQDRLFRVIDRDISHPVLPDFYRGGAVVDQVAVGAGRQARLQALRHRGLLGHGEEANLAAGEGHCLAVVPVVGHLGAGDGVAEGHHATDGRPAVLAHPAAAARAVSVDGDVSGTAGGGRMTSAVLPGERE